MVDDDGQNLTPATFKAKPKPPSPVLLVSGCDKRIITANPTESPAFHIQSCGYKQVRLHVRQVDSTDFIKFESACNFNARWKDAKKDIKPEKILDKVGKEAFTGVIDLNYVKNKQTITKVDVSQWLQNQDAQIGHLVVTVEPLEKDWKDGWETHPILARWVQVTKLGLTCFVTRADVVFWVTSLLDGSDVSAEVLLLTSVILVEAWVSVFMVLVRHHRLKRFGAKRSRK
jgi:hypothetical protein